MSFDLAPQLHDDTIHVGNLPVCQVLLMNNRRFPWLILVPMRTSLREMHDLDIQDYQEVMLEVRSCCELFAQMTNADKMNVAALGNMVPQLHIHVIARFTSDDAWPNPIWSCKFPPEPYAKDELEPIIVKLRTNLTSME